ncbi:MAG TPA: hypothetical protein PK339_12615 [Flavitalea sp.]|nr:hypothetical protein [Flavitalea sp.]
MSKIVIEKRSLRYDFSAVELHDLSLQLAKKNKEVVSLEEEKKAVTSQLAAKIKEADATVNILSEKVASGFEYREIECDVIFHKPQQGKKTIVRRDTNKKTAVESMTDYEWDLFNQPDENDTEDEDAEYQDMTDEDGGTKLLGNGDGQIGDE